MQVCLVTFLARPALIATETASIPLGWAMSALWFITSWASFLNKAPIDALFTLQILLLRIFVVTSEVIEWDSRVPCGFSAGSAPGYQVFTVETTPICHVVALFAETCSRQWIGDLISAFFTTFTDSLVHEEIVTNTLEALISRFTWGAASDSLWASLANAFI